MFVSSDETYIPTDETYVPTAETYVPSLGTYFLSLTKNFFSVAKKQIHYSRQTILMYLSFNSAESIYPSVYRPAIKGGSKNYVELIFDFLSCVLL